MVNKYFIALSLFTATSAVANEVTKEQEKEPEKIRVVGSRDSGIELTTDKILKVPGASNDPIKAVESLPGVVLADGYAPAVRGSSPNDMYYRSDEVPVGNVFHLDSYSTFHPNLIQSFELKTGAWESEFSDAIGGVIDTTLREPEFVEPTATVDLSFLRAGVLVETQITDSTAMYLAYRESLIHLYIENLLDEEDFEFQQAPINNDYQFKLLHNIDADNKLVFQATGSNDEVGILFSDESTEVLQNPDLAGGIGAESYYHNQSFIWSNYSWSGETKFIFNRLERSADFTIGQIIDLDATTVDYLFKVKNITGFDYGELTSGIDFNVQELTYQVSGKQQPCNDEFEVCLPSYYAPTVFEQAREDINFLTLFADYDWDIAEDWILKLGASYNSNDYNNQEFVEPRLALKWQVNDDYRLKAAYGQHHQWFREYKYLSDLFGAPDLDLAKAEHYVLGLEFEGDSDWAWRLEAYYKDMTDLIVSNPDAQVDSVNGSNSTAVNYLNEGVGTAYGIEFLVNKAISENWYGWVSVAYSKTERENQITDQSFNFVYDLPWIVNVVANYEINEEWQIGGRWRFQSGTLYTPIEGATPVYEDNVSVTDPLFYDPIEGEFNSERLEDFHRLDIRLDYKTKWFNKETNIYFEVLNLYGQQSLAGYEYNEDYTEREDEYQFPESPIPSIGIQMIF